MCVCGGGWVGVGCTRLKSLHPTLKIDRRDSLPPYGLDLDVCVSVCFKCVFKKKGGDP